MTLDRAGFPFIGGAAIPTLTLLLAGQASLALALTILPVAVALFFRDPERHPPNEPDVVVSPADGRVLYVGPGQREIAPPGDWNQISIFLSPLDVHVNRVPVSGRITRVDYQPGQFLPAYRTDAGTHNERSEVWLDHEGQDVVFRQVVGALARRVVCRVTTGTPVQTGERFGIMKFGSRMDLFLPPDAALVIEEGRRVRGGETIVARLTRSS